MPLTLRNLEGIMCLVFSVRKLTWQKSVYLQFL